MGNDLALEKVAPANAILVGGKLAIFVGMLLKFGHWKQSGIEVGMEAGKKNVD